MQSAVRVNEPRKLTRSEQLKLVSEEADLIWTKHRAGEISSEDAAKQLKELQGRYASFFDRLLAI